MPARLPGLAQEFGGLSGANGKAATMNASTLLLLPGETLAAIGLVVVVLWLLTLLGVWRTVRNSKEILEMIQDVEGSHEPLENPDDLRGLRRR